MGVTAPCGDAVPAIQNVERRGAVGIGHDAVALGFERNGHRGQDVAVVVDQRNGWHKSFVSFGRVAMTQGPLSREKGQTVAAI